MDNQQNLYCSSCGTKLDKCTQFCSSCGAKIGSIMPSYTEPVLQQPPKRLTNHQRKIEEQAVRKTAMTDPAVAMSWGIYVRWLTATWVISSLCGFISGSIPDNPGGYMLRSGEWVIIFLVSLIFGSFITSSMKKNYKNTLQDFINNVELIVEWEGENTVKVRVEGTEETARPWKSIR